jgi:hypothetical protein
VFQVTCWVLHSVVEHGRRRGGILLLRRLLARCVGAALRYVALSVKLCHAACEFEELCIGVEEFRDARGVY